MRIKLLNLGIIFIFLFLALGLLNLILLHGKEYKELSSKNCIRILAQPGSRGRILDRNNHVIVTNSLSYDVMVLPEGAEQLEATLKKVAGVLGLDLRDLKNRFQKGFRGESIPVNIARNIQTHQAIILEELRLDLRSIVIQPNLVRYYPYGRLACHIIGYLGEIDRWRLTKLSDYGYKMKDIVGFGGVEERYDYYLRQKDGGLLIEVDRQGRFMRVLGFKPPEHGKDIQLTLDLKLQQLAEKAFQDKKGSLILMDPHSGEILALVSRPNFNPAVFVKKVEPTIFSLFRNPEAPLFNRAISGVYPPGSVFKIIGVCAGLESQKLKRHTTFSCTGDVSIGKQEFSCWSRHGEQNLIEAIVHSCNIFFYRAGLLLGAQLLSDYAVKFGLGRITGIDLPYEEGGLVPSPLWKKIRGLTWYNGDTLNLSIGQGSLLVTPLQMARVMAVFANNGKLIVPHLIKSLVGWDISSFYQQKRMDLHLKENTLKVVREGLRGVVSDPTGTGSILRELPVSVAGKTGTAQVSGAQPHGWFAGFFPFSEPKFVLVVFLEHGGSGAEVCRIAGGVIETMIMEGIFEKTRT